MTTLELKSELEKSLPMYNFTISETTDSIWGVKKLITKSFKTENKATVITQNRVMFISGEMYPGTKDNFRYSINYTQSKIKLYRRKNWFDLEYEKKYVSGKTGEEILIKINEQFN